MATAKLTVEFRHLRWFAEALKLYGCVKQSEGYSMYPDQIFALAAKFALLNEQYTAGRHMREECLTSIEEAAGFDVYSIAR